MAYERDSLCSAAAGVCRPLTELASAVTGAPHGSSLDELGAASDGRCTTFAPVNRLGTGGHPVVTLFQMSCASGR